MKRTLLALLLPIAFGCGDPIADGDYLGEPLFRVSGRIEGDAGTSTIRSPWLAMMWWEPMESGEPSEARMITTVAPITHHRFPGTFTIEFFDLPPPSVQMPVFGSRIAMGIAVVIDDVDGNGRFDLDPAVGVLPPDQMFGWAAEQTILYVAEVGHERCGRWAFGDAVTPAPGYHVASWGACGSGVPFELQPPGQPLVVTLFPPGQFPEEQERDLEGDLCELPDCEADPHAPFCEMDEATNRCFEARCTPLFEQVIACANESCSGGRGEDPGCVEAFCGELQARAERCILEDCSFEAICSDDQFIGQ